jgi:1,2-diacylglycerol 3-alpha-glucosyltransferase
VRRARDRAGGLLFVWGSWGPYHVARMDAAAREATAANGPAVRGLELFGSSGVYDWVRTEPVAPLARLAIPGPEMRFPPIAMVTRVLPALVRIRPQVVFVPSYWPWSLAVNYASRVLGARVVMMNETHAATARPRQRSLWLKALVIRHFDAALVGGSLHRAYFHGLGLPDDRIFVGYDAVDNDWFAARSAAARASASTLRAEMRLPARYILSLGRLVEKKDIRLLIEAYARLLIDLPQAGVSLVIVGDGPEGVALRRLSIDLGLRVVEGAASTPAPENDDSTPAVYFFGAASPEECASYYALSEVFVLPSKLEEWGLVVNEAMACSTAVVVADAVGCAPDLVAPNEAGWTFSAGNVASLTNALEEAIHDPVERNERAARGYKHIGEWGLERFALGALAAANYATNRPRRLQATLHRRQSQRE